MPGADRLGVGIVGCGHWGPNHVRNFMANPKSRVVMCADRDEKRLDQIRRQFPDMRTTMDYGELISCPEIDAVVVSVPTVLHHEVCRAALKNGKHVLCEKPLTARGDQALELVALADRVQRILMVGHVFIFNAGIRYIRDFVACGSAGKIYYLRAIRTNLGPFRTDVNAAWDLATHDITIFNYLLQTRPISVSANGACYLQRGLEDVVFLSLEYPDGVVGTITASWLDPKKVRQLTLIGDQKMVTWDDVCNADPVRVYDRKVVQEPYYRDFNQFKLLIQEGGISTPQIPVVEPLSLQADCFLDGCHTGTLPFCSGREGAEVVAVLDAVNASIQTGGTRMKVNYFAGHGYA